MAVYLLGDGATDINGQVFRVQGYEIAKMGMIAFPQVDDQRRALGRRHASRLACRPSSALTSRRLPMPWPEPKA